MRPRIMIAVVLAALAGAQDRPVFRAQTSLVHVDAAVLDATGRVVPGLHISDFTVSDEGVVQPLSFFLAESQPLDLILLFDTSGSMHHKIKQVADVSRSALHELRAGDRVAVMTFSNSTDVVSFFSTDLDAVAASIESILRRPFHGSTHLRQAVDDAATFFRQEAPARRRRAILVITDNLGSHTRKEMPIVRNLWEADASVNGLMIPERARPMRFAVAVVAPYVLALTGGIDHIIEKTGGDALRAGDPSADFPEMMRRIRSRYSLYYATPDGPPGAYRNIRVDLAAEARERYPGARIYARRGYQLPRLN